MYCNFRHIFVPCRGATTLRIGLSVAIGVQNIGINDVLKTSGRYATVTTNPNHNTNAYPNYP